YSTLYGHMSRFANGIRKGSSVKQGQIIGYVGSTGLATGPHLHYEFHIGEKVVNPVTVTLPKAEGIAKNEMARFSAQIQPLFAQLKDAAGKPRVVAVQRGTPANQNAL
ncbi:MAG TPA: M23 family metallopeptidase, partial [Cellvibrionaceae bacterium]|nr:M23 family metallopeptidase [Cellvibrionaceae bacterium]